MERRRNRTGSVAWAVRSVGRPCALSSSGGCRRRARGAADAGSTPTRLQTIVRAKAQPHDPTAASLEPMARDGRGAVRISRWREWDVLDGLPGSAVPGARSLSGRRGLRALSRGCRLVPAPGVAVARPAEDDPDAARRWRGGVGHLQPAPLAAARRPTGRAPATGHLLRGGVIVKWGRPQGMRPRPPAGTPRRKRPPTRRPCIGP